MFVRISASIQPEHLLDGEIDARIQMLFRRLGYDLRLKDFDLAAGKPKTTSIQVDGKPRRVAIRSTLHYRDLGIRNLTDDMPDKTKAEIRRFCIFCGASAAHEAKIFVTRINDGHVILWVYQPNLDRLLPLCTALSAALRKDETILKVGDAGEDGGAAALISTGTPTTIATGDFVDKSLGRFADQRRSDCVLMATSLILFLFAYLIAGVPKNADGSDPINASLRQFCLDSWPPALAGLISILTVFAIGYWSAPRRHVRWKALG